MGDGKLTHNWKKLENPILKGSLVVKAYKNKTQTSTPTCMLSELTFLTAITFTSPRVAATPLINMADKKAEVVSISHVLLCSHPSDVRLYRVFYGMWKT